MNKKDDRFLWKYAGLATQFLAGTALALYVGIKADDALGLNTPLAVWVLPLLLITGVIYAIVKDTSRKK